MIKAVIFDLDNTLIDFMRMKKLSCDAAITAMMDAGLDVEKEEATKSLFELYDKYGLEEKQIFQHFLKKLTGEINYEVLASGIVAYRRVRTGFLEPYPYVGKVLFELKKRGIKLGKGKLIPISALNLKENSDSEYGLVFELKEDAKEFEDLSKYRWDYQRDQGLARACRGVCAFAH